ncbi:hypothetical protein EVAR_74545_1 [Eumeta japonica]|uniref:Uncharacterized protein n=1 Tax=Eumeta variegata TaxID=151549 RepID=A0A4C1TCT2_EUMVA|nr:hypothetical protein EVAR_74545_1 [Eumeta japonica]
MSISVWARGLRKAGGGGGGAPSPPEPPPSTRAAGQEDRRYRTNANGTRKYLEFKGGTTLDKNITNGSSFLKYEKLQLFCLINKWVHPSRHLRTVKSTRSETTHYVFITRRYHDTVLIHDIAIEPSPITARRRNRRVGDCRRVRGPGAPGRQRVRPSRSLLIWANTVGGARPAPARYKSSNNHELASATDFNGYGRIHSINDLHLIILHQITLTTRT